MGLPGRGQLPPASKSNILGEGKARHHWRGFQKQLSFCVTGRRHTVRPAPLVGSITVRRATESWGNEERHRFDILLQFSLRRGDLKQSCVKTKPNLSSTLTLWASRMVLSQGRMSHSQELTSVSKRYGRIPS